MRYIVAPGRSVHLVVSWPTFSIRIDPALSIIFEKNHGHITCRVGKLHHVGFTRDDHSVSNANEFWAAEPR